MATSLSASSTRTLTLPRPHSAQLRVKREAARFNVVCCGRRWGKTILGEDRLIGPALEGKPVAWFSPTYKMLAEVWRDLRRVLTPVSRRVSAQEHRIELLTGGVVECWSLDSPDVARGRKYARMVIDEAAMIADLEDAWQSVLRPTLADYAGGAWFLSTPKGRNYFWALYQRGLDPEQREWASWQMPTTANPYIDPNEIEALRLGATERAYQQEVLAAFLEDGGSVFRRVTEAATAQPQERRVDGHQYVMGVDWGRTEDFTVLSVIDTATNALVALDRFNQIDYLGVQVPRLMALYERFKPHAIIAEENSMGAPVIEALVRLDLPVTPFKTTNATKAAVIEGLALAFERADLAILPDPVLLGELQAYEADRLPSGLLRYSAPPGSHDDCVMSLAFAWEGARTSGPLLLWGSDQYD